MKRRLLIICWGLWLAILGLILAGIALGALGGPLVVRWQSGGQEFELRLTGTRLSHSRADLWPAGEIPMASAGEPAVALLRSSHWHIEQELDSSLYNVNGRVVPMRQWRTHYRLIPCLLTAGLLPPGIWLGWCLWGWLRRPHVPKPGSCPQCGYDLTGNVSGICPECGTSVPSEKS